MNIAVISYCPLIVTYLNNVVLSSDFVSSVVNLLLREERDPLTDQILSSEIRIISVSGWGPLNLM
jgi:hypothetical protein